MYVFELLRNLVPVISASGIKALAQVFDTVAINCIVQSDTKHGRYKESASGES